MCKRKGRQCRQRRIFAPLTTFDSSPLLCNLELGECRDWERDSFFANSIIIIPDDDESFWDLGGLKEKHMDMEVGKWGLVRRMQKFFIYCSSTFVVRGALINYACILKPSSILDCMTRIALSLGRCTFSFLGWQLTICMGLLRRPTQAFAISFLKKSPSRTEREREWEDFIALAA